MDPSLTLTEHSTSTAKAPPALDLSSAPPVLVLPAHFKDDELKEFETTLRHIGAPLTTQVSEAKVFIGKVSTKRRAEFELRSRKLLVEEFIGSKRTASPTKHSGPEVKRRRVGGSRSTPIRVTSDGSTTEEESLDSETEDESKSSKQACPSVSSPKSLHSAESLCLIFEKTGNDDVIWVVKVNWILSCIAANRVVPLADDLIYKGKAVKRPSDEEPKPRSMIPFCSPAISKAVPASQAALAARTEATQSILDRAKSDATGAAPAKGQLQRGGTSTSRRFEGASFMSSAHYHRQNASQTAHLLQQTTSEYDGEDSDFPPAPEWVKKDIKYACQRFTPSDGRNEEFITLLKRIRTARTLIDDGTGVRAYSTIIAAIAAYPYELNHPRELLRLPGCDMKAAELFVEWKNTGRIRAVEDFEEDEAMKVLRLFYDIWGVGAKTARSFYYSNHWTELDDIVEFGWNDLDRVQQIGVKYYEEFLDPIPRSEVQQIADTVRHHAVRIRDDRITITIVGGYRRGKGASGDVDLIISHPVLESTAYLVRDLVEALEEEEWITHTLTMSLHNTNRGQSTLPFRTTKAAGAGFDTLDKALVVWQNPQWQTREADRAANPNARNPNIHRRVDIIISPWRTVGCAVMGWSGGTTFQRDLRRYAKAVKGWKFDSSGIRNRSTGELVQLEGLHGVDGTPEDAERRVFEGMGLAYIPPEMRCTN